MAEFFAVLRDVLLPVFGVAGIAYLAGPRLGLDQRTLSRLAFYVLAPAFVFDVLAGADLGIGNLPGLVAVLAVTSVVMTGVAVAAGRLIGATPTMVAALVIVAVFGNVGNFGLAITTFAFGDEALLPASVAFLTVNFSAFAIGITAASWHRHSPLRALGRALTTPPLLAMPVALIVNLAGLDVPTFLDRGVGLAAQAMIPVMLIALGVQLAAMDGFRFGPAVAAGGALRLAVAPLVALGVASVVGVSGLDADVAVLQSAMPAAVFAAVIGIEFDVEPDFLTTAVLVTTLASAVTLAIALSLLGG